jgi:hypothetical protein
VGMIQASNRCRNGPHENYYRSASCWDRTVEVRILPGFDLGQRASSSPTMQSTPWMRSRGGRHSTAPTRNNARARPLRCGARPSGRRRAFPLQLSAL